MRVRRFTIWTMMALVAVTAMSIAAWRGGKWFFDHQKDDFLRLIHAGDAEAYVLRSVGEPVERISAGSTLRA